MLRSLFSGISGLRGHQTMMDVVGNNIANVNTTGFKSSSATFQDLLSQVVKGAGSPTGDTGGTNPAQVGLGSRLSAIQQNFSQGALQVTGRSSDVAIQGDGFFVANIGGQQVYTRAGNFGFDAVGNLVTTDGALVQGWMADPVTKQINSTSPVGNLTMPPGQLIAPVQTTGVQLGNMLSANAATGATVVTAIEVYDTQGVGQDIKFTFEKTDVNEWTVTAVDAAGNDLGDNVLTFDPATGLLDSASEDPWEIEPEPADNFPVPIVVSLFGTANTDTNAIKEYGGTSTAAAVSQNGSPAGTLQSFSIADDGVVSGVFSNGKTQQIGQLALASFTNPGGLEKAGSSTFRTTPNSGIPQIGPAGVAGRGRLAAGSVEMSNVDLAAEFTNLIIAQRGFQANSRVITSSDEILQDLINLKR